MMLMYKLVAVLIICLMPNIVLAWVTPVNLATENGDDTGRHEHIISGTEYDRCDTDVNVEYFTDPVPPSCHRSNLVWSLGSSDDLVQWNPKIGATGWRLPTIKELGRLMNYASASTLSAEQVILSWFEILELKDSWLISSTYRDIDGQGDPNVDGGKGNAQIFGINMGNGEIAAFDTVITSGTDTVGPDEEPAAADDTVGENVETVGPTTATELGITTTTTVTTTVEVVDNGGGTKTKFTTVTTDTETVELRKCVSLKNTGECDSTTSADVFTLLVKT